MRPSLSTTGGDKGTTGLYGGERVSKSSVRLHAYGTVDELNAIIGLVLSESDLQEPFRTQLHEVQKDLFCLGADLATPLRPSGFAGQAPTRIIRISANDTQRLEQWGVHMEEALPTLQKFILPSGCKAASLLHLARTVCRRAERWMVHLAEEESINDQALIYVNRLSDYFFLLARTVNKEVGVAESQWLPEANQQS